LHLRRAKPRDEPAGGERGVEGGHPSEDRLLPTECMPTASEPLRAELEQDPICVFWG
jgi:hypothetical protein